MTLAINGYAAGGSSVLKRHCRADQPTYHWFDEYTGKPGPLLVAAVNHIDAQITSGNTPTDILWLQGQQDSIFITDDTTADLWALCTQMVLLELRKAIRPSNPYSIAALIEPSGRRVGTWSNNIGIDLIRQRQVSMVSSGTAVNWLVEVYDVECIGDASGNGDSHWTTDGRNRVCDRVGARAARLSGRFTSPMGPALSGADLAEDRCHISLSVSAESGCSIDPKSLYSPCGFGSVDAAGPIAVTSAVGTGGGSSATIVLTLERPAQGPVTVLYPSGSMQPFDDDRVIRYSNYDRPLRTVGRLAVTP